MNKGKVHRAQPQAGAWRLALHIFVLTQLAIAYPLYDLLSKFPEFFVARQSQPPDIWLFVFSLSFILPAIWVAVVVLSYRINRRLGQGLRLFSIALLFFLLSLYWLSGTFGPWLTVIFAVMFCLALSLVYFKSNTGPLFITFLAPGILVVPLLFMLNEGVAALLRSPEPGNHVSTAEGGNLSPIVFVVFDEFPTFVLMDESGKIDAKSFPNFAALAEGAHWFPNATTVATSTILALPPIVTGRYPTEFVMPHLGEYRDNLFTWLGNSYDLNVEEAVTAFCPQNLCSTRRIPSLGVRMERLLLDGAAVYLNIVASGLFPGYLPVVTQSWGNFWSTSGGSGQMYEHRMEQLSAFVERIQVTDRPGLDFLHINFPHVPYEYLPSGKRYDKGWLMPGLDFATDTWANNGRQTYQAFRRFKLQVQALDKWLGYLLERLHDLNLYDSSVIVLTADHGVSFTPGSSRRDYPPLENLERNILPVPLIIKVPGQTEGSVSFQNAETIDIVPTLAEILNRPAAWDMDGVSLLGEPKPVKKHAVHQYKKLVAFETDVERVQQGIMHSVRGSREHAAAVLSEDLFFQAQNLLLGQKTEDLNPVQDPVTTAKVFDLDRYEDVRLNSAFLPAHVTGTIFPAMDEPVLLAVSLNGRLEAFAESFQEGGRWKFSAMLPERAFQNGNNTLRVYRVESRVEGKPELFEIGLQQRSVEETWSFNGSRLARGGETLPTDTEGIQGRLDYISFGQDLVEIIGWAIDAAESRPVQSVLVFDRGSLLYEGETNMLREETHDFGVILKVGFQVVVPMEQSIFQNRSRLRVFAVTEDGRSKELELK